MIIHPGDPNAVSFNDDSSPDSRLTSDQKLSVNAQVLREDSLDWFYRILQCCATVPGELKSAEVWPRFQALPEVERARVWTGLSKVRIHITDPRPYRESFDDSLRSLWRRDDAAELLSNLVAQGRPDAKMLLRQREFNVADSILFDSMAARVHRLSRALNEELMFLADDERADQDEVFDLSEFGSDTKPMVRKVSAWSAKSAATFHEALDCFLEFDEELAHLRYFPNSVIRRKMEARVLTAHAFDKGDSSQIELLESARGSILRHLRTPETTVVVGHKPYSEIGSAESYLVQAADIAAGIASRILEIQHLVAAVSCFQYVTYNGLRMSLADAEEEVRKMRLWPKHTEVGR